ncbi:uncharacterized protein LOC143280426 [Babylonia areolata]|uniref:uncharacterized protein LOC143280426 n=1 Tax=Babylonia areolata TaxID=304850 RepID=UPI003FCF7A86
MGKKIQCLGRYTMEGLTLGKGNFARVELAHHTVTGVKVAIKIIDRSKLKDNQKDHLHREARILGQLRHPNIVRLYETLKATTLHCLVLEFAAGGELQTYVRCHKDGRLPEEKSRPFVRQMVSGLHYLHERGVTHRDLKMENIMLDEKRKHVKIVDFGLSITFTKDELMRTHCGSPEYAAPEMNPANDRYGPEIDVWSLGIVMYAMMIGHLPFTTPYTDHYRRLKLVQQMEKGLVETHNQEMAILSQDGQDLLRKVIEPSPELRIPLLDMEVHPWITNHGKLPFYPFQAFPRDKTMRTQGNPSLRQQTILELSQKLGIKKEHVEQKVGETKSDEMSAMYNMLLDNKRRDQGLFDVDHTSKQMERREPKTKRRAKSAPADKKEKGRVKGKIGAPEVCVESAPHSGSDATGEPETRMTSFDFLALCSTPSWLGPERRRSRRRGRSPIAAAQHKNTDGMSVRSQLRRDYMERHGIEATHTVAGRDDHHHAPPHTHHNHITTSGHQASNPSHFLTPDHAASNLSVPDIDGINPHLHRGSSLKLSRKRARSFGPGQRRRSSFKRSGSVDTPVQSGPEDAENSPLQCAKSETLATNSPSTLSMAAASLAVAFGGQTPKVLTLQVPALKASPVPRPANLTLKECYSLNLGTAPKPSSLNPSRPVKSSLAPPVNKGLDGGGGGGGRKGPLTSVEVHVSDTTSPPCPPVPNTVLDSSSPEVMGAVAGAECQVSVDVEKLDLPSTSQLAQAWSTESLLEDREGPTLPSPEHQEVGGAEGAAAGPGHLLPRPLHLLDRSQRPVFHQQVPAPPLSLHHRERPRLQKGYKGATAMQLGVSKSPLHYGSPPVRRPDARHIVDSVRGRKLAEETREGFSTTLEPDLRALTLDDLVGATGISGNFHVEDYEDDADGLENEVEVMTEDEDVVFMSESDPIQPYLGPPPKNRAVGGIIASAQQHRLPSPDEVEEDLLLLGTGSASGTAAAAPAVLEYLHRRQRGSTGSHSQASSSGSKSQIRGSVPLQGGKLKTPTTPLSWMVLRSPLARIESFHSDDFDYYNSSDNEPAEHASVASASPMSASTPTVPCFAYRLNMPRKKPPKLKKGTAGDNTAGKTGKKTSASGMKGSAAASIPDTAITEPLLSSGSDNEFLDDVGDKSAMLSKARVHPEDKESERQLLKTENKAALCNNVITQQPCRQSQQNSVNKVSTTTTATTQGGGGGGGSLESKKKPASKNSPWKRSFAQFLKRKRQSPRCNNNNNDCASPMLPANHNGCSPASPVTKVVESNNVQTSLVVVNNTAGDLTGEVSAETGNCKPRVFVPPPAENNIAGKRVQP